MLAALLFAACTCTSHDPFAATLGVAQNALAIFWDGLRVDKLTGERQTITTESDGMVDVDGALLYFSHGSSLRVVSAYGGASYEIAAAGERIEQIFHDAVSIYWVEGFPLARLFRVDKKNGSVEMLLDGFPAFRPAVGFDERAIYAVIDRVLWRLDKRDLSRTPLASGFCEYSQVIVDGTNVYACGFYVPRSGGRPQKIPGPDGELVGPAGRWLLKVVLIPGFKGVPAPAAEIYDLCTGRTDLLATLGAVSLAADACDIYYLGNPLDMFECHTQSSFITAVEPPVVSPEGGTLLSIYGAGFTSNDRVFVGDAPATVVSTTSNLITAIAPPAPRGATVLKVISSDRCTGTLFTVAPPPRREAAEH